MSKANIKIHPDHLENEMASVVEIHLCDRQESLLYIINTMAADGLVRHTRSHGISSHGTSLIARFMGPTWGPSGADRTQVGPMLAPWTLLSGLLTHLMMTSSNGNIFRITGHLWIHWSLVNSLHKEQWCGAFMFSLICTWINSWVNNDEAGGLKCHRAHYNVTVMWCCGWDIPRKSNCHGFLCHHLISNRVLRNHDMIH